MVKTSVFVLTPDIGAIPGCDIISGPFEETIPLAKELGYDMVELDMGDPFLFDVQHFQALLKRHGMGVSLINTGNISYAFGFSLVNDDPEKEREALIRFKKIIDLACQLGCVVQAGISRGVALQQRSYSLFKTRLVQVYRELADYAQQKGATIMLEYTNRLEINTINNFREAREIIQRVDRPNFKLLLDTYHSYLEDEDVYETIREAAPYVKAFHFHDSDRGPAGASNGCLDFEKIFKILAEIRFDGFLSDGLVTMSLPKEQVQRSTAFLREMIRSYRL